MTRILNKQRTGYKIKYNVNEMMFYSPNETKKLRRLYRFEDYQSQKFGKSLAIGERRCLLTGLIKLYLPKGILASSE